MAQGERFFDREFVWPAILLGLFFFLSACIASYTFYSVRALDNTFSVTGSAKESVKADTAKWTIQVYRTAFESDLTSSYARVSTDLGTVKNYFVQAGIPAESITIKTITADQDWSYSSQGGPVRYRVHQDIIIESKDVEKIAGLAQGINQLLARGVLISINQPEYYVSTLPDLRVSLLGKAIADAKARAQSIAQSGGSSVGSLKSAASGIVQVLPPNSTNVEDYGSYDTSTIEKEVSVTVRATFYVK
jgi:hypothetical protein